MPHTPEHIEEATPLNPIGVEELQTNEEVIPFQTAADTTVIPDVAGLGQQETVELTDTQSQAQDILDELSVLSEETLGESSFRAKKEEEAGLPDQEGRFRDLQAQLKGLQNEALAIPLQLQEQAQGRGITAAGLRPLQTARLRENAIRALTTASFLEATRGNIETATNLVDRAVNQKFDPIKERIEASLFNLNLITKSPQFTLDQKKQAQQLEFQQMIRKAQIDAEVSKEKAKQDLLVKGIGAGISASVINQAKDLNYTDAFELLSPGLVEKAQNDTKAQEDLRDLQLEFERARIDDLNSRIESRATEALLAKKAKDIEAKNEREAATEKSLAIFDLANKVKGMDGLSSAVGFGFGKSVLSKIPLVEGAPAAGGKRANFEAQATRLANLLTVDNLKLMSGVLSETDIKILESAGSLLGNFDVSEETYLAELDRITDVAERNYKKLGITDEQASFWFDINQEDSNEINEIYGDPEETEVGSTFDPSKLF